MRPEISIHLDEMMPVIVQTLSEGHSVRFSPNGNSMKPMLHSGRDQVTLVSPPTRLHRFDLPLYRLDNGKYVLHRVVAVKEDGYICLGDNTEVFEQVRHDQIIAVVTSFCRKGREYSVSGTGYRMYCMAWRPLRPLRKFLKRVRRVLTRVFS